jgi:hypothetical protein
MPEWCRSVVKWIPGILFRNAPVTCTAPRSIVSPRRCLLRNWPPLWPPPLFDVRFALQNHPVPDVNLPGITSQLKMRSTGTARFELGCEITEEGMELEVVWLYRPRILTNSGPETLHQRFLDVISHACRYPDGAGATFNPETP